LSIAFPLLALLLGILWLAGGASRPDVLGQVIARGTAWLMMMAAILFGTRFAAAHIRPVLLFMLAAVLLPMLQLIPLPAEVWTMLPGRKVFAETGIADDTWRPWSLVPGATINAASSLVVPAATLLLVSALDERERRWLLGLLLALVSASTLIGLLQFSGTRFDHPLVNGTVGAVSGAFANRNHFALFTAFGCLLAPVWAFVGEREARWRGSVAGGLVAIFALTILASGSRVGILVGVLALGVGLALSWAGIRRELRRAPKWVFPSLIAVIVGTVAILVLISVAADRAQSVNRALAADVGQDMRSRGLATVLAMIETYFPVGTGFGSFDPMFRIHEPFALLKPTYFNHAHNDFLEIVLDGGLPALILLLAALGWWAFASVRVWRAGADPRYMVPKLGSAILLLVFIASAFDYPARTPMMMAMIVIAAVWLSRGAAAAARAALPEQDQPL
jgi:O-antigen ligase